MKCRIMIEDENGLFQAELEKDKSVLEVTQNLRNLLNMKEVGTYIIVTDYANCTIRGNAEKIAKQYDALTQFMIKNNPEIIQRVLCAWAVRTKK